MVKNLLRRNNLLPMVLASCTPQKPPTHFSHCHNIECVQVGHPWDVHKAMQKPWSLFRCNRPWQLLHLARWHSHQQIFQSPCLESIMRILNFQRWKLPPSNFSMTFKDSIWKEDILNTNATTNTLKLESWSFQQLKELSSKDFHFETWYFQKQVFHTWKTYNTLKKSLPHFPPTWKDYYSLCNLAN